MFCFLPSERERDFISPCETIFRKLPSSIIHENFSKLDLSSGAHVGNQMLPSVVAASSMRLRKKKKKELRAGASQRCEMTPLGGQRRGSQPKSVTWILFNVPHLSWLLHSTAQATLTEMSLLSDGAPKKPVATLTHTTTLPVFDCAGNLVANSFLLDR